MAHLIQGGATTMIKLARKPLVAMTVLAAAMAMPMAFAQVDPVASPPLDPWSQPAPLAEPQDAATVAETPPGTEPPPQAEPAATGADRVDQSQAATSQSGQQGWEEVDADKDGAISKQEAASNARLSQIFDQADADADGILTADEYRGYLEQNHSEPQTP